MKKVEMNLRFFNLKLVGPSKNEPVSTVFTVSTGGWSDFKVYILAITLPADMLCNKYMDM